MVVTEVVQTQNKPPHLQTFFISNPRDRAKKVDS